MVNGKIHKVTTCILMIILFASLSHGAEWVAGKGVLKAMGSGNTFLKGSMLLKISGSGFLLIDPGDQTLCPISIDVTGRGKRYILEDGQILYAGWKGRANIRGCDYKVAISGSNIDLIGIGNGQAYLGGCGWFKTYSRRGVWDSSQDISFGPVENETLNELLSGDIDPSKVDIGE